MRLPSRSGGRGEKRLLAGLTLIVVIAVVVAIVLVTRSPGSGNASAHSSTGTNTTSVQRRNLVATDTESGTLSYANSQTIYNRISGTITWLPKVGQEIRPGRALFRIDNHPIVLMNGPTPAYRDLSASAVQGPDVLELNRNLIALGFNPDGIVADDIWQAATTAGVEQFQASLGEPETGNLTLGQVVFLPGVQLISTVDGTVGSTGGGSGGASPSSQASYDPTGSHTEFVGLTTTTQTSSTTTTTPTSPTTHQRSHSHKHHRSPKHHSESLAALVALLQAEIQELRAQQHSGAPASSGPSSSNNNSSNNNSKNNSSKNHSKSNHSSNNSSSNNNPSSSGSSGGGSATEILQSSSTHLVVTVDLAASSQSEAVRGEHVTVEMPNNTTVNGVITQVSKVAQTSSSSGSGAGAGGGTGSGGSSATIPVTIRLLGHVTGAGLDQAPVSVNFAQAKARNVLSVPVTALVATAGGNYAVQEAAAPHKLIPVRTGLFAAGYVAISGAGIYEGLQVTDSQG